MNKIGFACKVVECADFPNPLDYHTKTTTVTALSKLSQDDMMIKLDSLICHNLQAIFNLVSAVAKLLPVLRMVRLPSDILPLYTHPITACYYNQSTVLRYVELELSKIGNVAKLHNVRLSFHPAQMILISSTKDDVVTKSIVELEYHAYLARAMGYCNTFQDIKCNIHVNGGGSEYFRKNFYKLSTDLRNIITIENDEYTSPLESCLTLTDLCPVVFDIHHQWIYTGNYLSHTDPLIDRVIDSWKGVTPTMHASVSQARLLKNGRVEDYTSKELRRHSSLLWNSQVNDILYGYHHHRKMDIMVEAKYKNLASFELYKHFYKSDVT